MRGLLLLYPDVTGGPFFSPSATQELQAFTIRRGEEMGAAVTAYQTIERSGTGHLRARDKAQNAPIAITVWPQIVQFIRIQSQQRVTIAADDPVQRH